MNDFFPEILVAYLLSFRQAFYQAGWRYFQGFIWSMLLSGGRKCVTRLAGRAFSLIGRCRVGSAFWRSSNGT
jgi:hypothetical protein